jgi:hypothetical protein
MYSKLPKLIFAAKPQRMTMHFTVRVKESQFVSRFTKYVGLLSLLIPMGAGAMPASPRQRALEHIDRATRAADRAHTEWLKEYGLLVAA